MEKELSFNDYKQFLDIIADEINVKEIDISVTSEKGDKIMYNRKSRKFITHSK